MRSRFRSQFPCHVDEKGQDKQRFDDIDYFIGGQRREAEIQLPGIKEMTERIGQQHQSPRTIPDSML